jgi:integrase
MDPKTLALLDKTPKKNKIKTFDQGFELACLQRPSWNLNRGKNTQAQNVRRDFLKFQDIAGKNVPISLLIENPTFIDIVRDKAKVEYNWTNKTVNKFLSMISTVFIELRRAGVVTQVPNIVYLPKGEGRCEWYTKDQVEALCKISLSYEDHAMSDLILFAAYTGMRSQELRLLKAGDFDFRDERPFVTVGGTPDTATKTDESGVSWRRVPIPDRILPLSQRLVDGQGLNKRVFGEMFSNRQIIARRFERVREIIMHTDVSITKMHKFKSLRDSFGTWQCAAGVPLVMVSRIMGHTNTKQTLKYVHNTQDYIRETGNAI